MCGECNGFQRTLHLNVALSAVDFATMPGYICTREEGDGSSPSSRPTGRCCNAHPDDPLTPALSDHSANSWQKEGRR